MNKKNLNIIFYGIVLLLLLQRIPSLIDQYKMEGKPIQNLSMSLLDGKIDKLADLKGNKVLIFWATWCPPCKVELKRFSKALKERELPRENLFFVNMGEDEKTIRKFMKQKNYDFKVVMDKDQTLSSILKVVSTPTVIHLNEKNIIKYVGTGISPLGIFRAKWLFE